MGAREDLIKRVSEKIYPNGRGLINGLVHQKVLIDVINTLWNELGTFDPAGNYPNLTAGKVVKSIKFKDLNGNPVAFDGSSEVDLTAGVNIAAVADKLAHVIKFKDGGGNIVLFDGSSDIDLSGGITASKVSQVIKFTKKDNTQVSFDGSSEVDLTGGIKSSKETEEWKDSLTGTNYKIAVVSTMPTTKAADTIYILI